jgi:hypothetical protein
MNRQAFGLAVLFGAMVIVPGDVIGQGKKAPKDQPVAATAQDYYLIQNQKSLTAHLQSLDDAKGTVSVRIDFPEWLPNPNYRAAAQNALLVEYNRLQHEQQQVQASRSAAAMQQHYTAMKTLQARIAVEMARANNAANAPFMQVSHSKDFEFDLQEKAALRKMFLTVEYDDTGRLKEYTAKEKEELRGKNEPKGSYAAKPGEFHAGQGVWVYLSPPKKESAAAAKEKKDDKNAMPPKPTVKMLVIYQDAQQSTAPAAAPKKKQ